MGQDPHRRIRVACVPSGEGDVLVLIELVVGVPTEYHIAEGQPVFEDRKELVAADVLASHHAVHVVQADLHVLDVSGLDDRLGIRH